MSQLDDLTNLLKLPQLRQPTIPPPLILAAKNRSGVSQTRVTEKVFARENEIFNADNPHRQMYAIIIDELLKEIRENGVIEIAIPPNAIVTSTGVDASGVPVTTIGQITNIQTGVGILK